MAAHDLELMEVIRRGLECRFIEIHESDLFNGKYAGEYDLLNYPSEERAVMLAVKP